MTYEYYIGAIDEESVLVECGPMRLAIRAWYRNQPQLKLARQAAEKSIAYLEQIARCRRQLSRPIAEIVKWPEDNLALEMITSVKTVGDQDLTPMAAVAGTIADAVADWLFERGATRVIVDNGGDIAIRLAAGETATVGIRPRINSFNISHIARLDGHRSSWGVTTSGVGGRSFTKGIASAVTVIAANASLADAAATAIGNACFVEDSSIVQVPAEEIDPNTDLKGVNVTVEMGSLHSEKMIQAVETALSKANVLYRQGRIIGAFIALDNVFMMTESIRKIVSLLN